MRIQARRLAPGGMTHQSVAAAGVDVERRAPDWNGDPDNGEAALAADNPADRRPPAMEGGEASSEASCGASGKANAAAAALPASDLAPSAGSGSWHGRASLRFSRGGDGLSRHQGSASAPLKNKRKN